MSLNSFLTLRPKRSSGKLAHWRLTETNSWVNWVSLSKYAKLRAIKRPKKKWELNFTSLCVTWHEIKAWGSVNFGACHKQPFSTEKKKIQIDQRSDKECLQLHVKSYKP